MDLKEQLAKIVSTEDEMHLFNETGLWHNGANKTAQAIIDFLPEFIVLSDKDKPQVGDSVISETGMVIDVFKIDGDKLFGTFDDCTNVVEFLDDCALYKRNGLPVLIKKGD
jgi:hypothetical protein